MRIRTQWVNRTPPPGVNSQLNASLLNTEFKPSSLSHSQVHLLALVLTTTPHFLSSLITENEQPCNQPFFMSLRHHREYCTDV